MAPTESNAGAPSLPASYYAFGSYVTKNRMLTFWHQLDEIFKTSARSVLEIGIGPGVVAGTLRQLGVAVTTFDVNDSLKPDVIGSVVDLDRHFGEDAFDTVLCARVLHHLPFEDFDTCLQQLAKVAKKRVIVTLPCDELRFYASVRRTAGSYKTFSCALPLKLKRVAARLFLPPDDPYRRLWKIGSSTASSKANVRAAFERHFNIISMYSVPEDQSHIVVVLRPR